MDIRQVENTYTAPGVSQSPGADAKVVEPTPAAPPKPVKSEDLQQQHVEVEGEAKTSEEVERIADSVNTVMEQTGSHIRFVMHEEADTMMVQVRDDSTDEVIRTIPSKELLDIAAKVGEMVGMLLDERT